MSKIIVEKIELKNFFSYGNSWQSVDLREGVNIVLGHDKDKDRSNGAGKTSFLEAIPYALFGQTSKGVALPKIINWKNGKQCEVKLHFKKDDISYVLHRGIKPGILNLSKNGVDVPKLSDKRVFQMELENDLIGMDFKAAQALLFQNANNMVSIFNTPKAEKRRFIEKFFNLEVYSKMNEHTNSKLQNIIKRLSEISMENDFKNRRIEELEDSIEGRIIPDIKSYEKTLKKSKKQLSIFLKDNVINDDRVKELEVELETYQAKRTELNAEHRETLQEISRIEDKYNLLNGEKLTLERRIETIGDVSDQRIKYDKIDEVLKTMPDFDGFIDDEQIKYDSSNEERTEVLSRLMTNDREQKKLNKEVVGWTGHKTTDDVTCPTCFQKVNYDHIKTLIDEKVDELNGELQSLIDEKELDQEVSSSLKSLMDESSLKITGFKDKQSKKLQLEQHLIRLSGVEEKEQEIVTTNERIKEINDEILPVVDTKRKEQQLKIDVISVDIGLVGDSILTNQSEQTDYTELVQKKLRLDQDTVNEQKIYDSQKEIYDRVELEQQADITLKTQLVTEVSEFDSEIKKLETMKDYLDYIKTTLKDENVKQYAIGNIIPYLQQQTNHYLAETGHNYYIELDAWLDGTIQGYGVGDCEFGNMSGGEGKSIDLALKFAMMDVARRQAGSYLDVLVLDELLDSSIDSFGIEKTFDIIKLKQREDNLKVFIVSHREEVADFGNDSVYRVEKEDGFSTVKVV